MKIATGLVTSERAGLVTPGGQGGMWGAGNGVGMQGGCPFCHPDPDSIFFETDWVRGIWGEGQALLVPRRHVGDWFGASGAEQRELMAGLAEVRDAMGARGHFPDGFRVEMNWGGPEVAHLQVRVIPRYGGESKGRLVTGDGEALLRHLQENLDGGVRADIAVAFVTVSGLEKILPRLGELLERGGRVRFLTGDQELFNHPAALRRLLDLGVGEGCEVRVFECDGKHHFHPKFYLFENGRGELTAFVGSSNLTEQALRKGIEWNYRVGGPDEALQHLRAEFERLFHHPNTRALDEPWLAAYEARRPLSPMVAGGASLAAETGAPADEELPPPPEPHEIQQEALAALERTRAEGYRAGLVVLATGLGKTWLAAFDSAKFRRVLFVAHREEILTQARDTFRRIRPGDSFGLYTGQQKAPQADTLFASIQTLGRSEHLQKFPPDAFDYIIIDEFHHASAASYRRLLEHFQCRFRLGLTATPERTDGGNLLALCEENLVYRCDFWEGIRRERLCSFHYFGVPDVVDYQNIPWRSRFFDPQELENALISQVRALNALEQYRKHAGKRTLAFCCSMAHADSMAEFFQSHPLRSVASDRQRGGRQLVPGIP